MSTKIISPLALISYPHLAEPQKAQDGKPAKYSCALVFTPELLALPGEKERFQAMELATIEAARTKFGSKAEALIKTESFRKPFRRDAADKGYPEGSVFVNVRSDNQPLIVYAYAGVDGKPVRMLPENIKKEMYAGVVVRASLSAFGYDNSGNRGVSFGLNNLQKIRDGERLDGRTAPENEFDVDLNAVPADLSDIT